MLPADYYSNINIPIKANFMATSLLTNLYYILFQVDPISFLFFLFLFFTFNLKLLVKYLIQEALKDSPISCQIVLKNTMKERKISHTWILVVF